MNDLISRQAAIVAVNKYFSRIGKLKRHGLKNTEKAINMDLIYTIGALPSAKQWIPCAERKPEKEKEVLICTDNGMITDGIFYGDGEIIEWDGATGDRCFDSDEVIAWMPLPEPYKEQTNA